MYVEVAVMGSPSLILVTVFTVSVDVGAGRSCVKVTEVGFSAASL